MANLFLLGHAMRKGMPAEHIMLQRGNARGCERSHDDRPDTTFQAGVGNRSVDGFAEMNARVTDA
jgi:hypothetical protein